MLIVEVNLTGPYYKNQKTPQKTQKKQTNKQNKTK